MDTTRTGAIRRRGSVANATPASSSVHHDSHDATNNGRSSASANSKEDDARQSRGSRPQNGPPASASNGRGNPRVRGWNGNGAARGIQRACRRLGALRVADAALFLAATANVLLLSRCRMPMSGVFAADECRRPPAEEATTMASASGDGTRWSLPEWARRRGTAPRGPPFHAPLLFWRHNSDEHALGYDVDDDGASWRERRRVRGMFPAHDSHYRRYRDLLHDRGYAVVDDVIFEADDRREDLAWALDLVRPRPNPAPRLLSRITKKAKKDHFKISAFGLLNHMRNHTYVEDDDLWDPYIAGDDDYLLGTIGMGRPESARERRGDYDQSSEDEREDDEYYEEPPECAVPDWYFRYKPTCNEIHAAAGGPQFLLGENVYVRRWEKRRRRRAARDERRISKYLGSGYFRDAFLLFLPVAGDAGEGPPAANREDKVVFKTMKHLYEGSKHAVADDDVIKERKWGHDPADRYGFATYKEYMRKDALVMELLSATPRAIDLYAHCAMSSVVEFAGTDMDEALLPTVGFQPRPLRGSTEDLEGRPLNSEFSPAEKLVTALEMAKCLAVMHGHPGGPITNNDVQVGVREHTTLTVCTLVGTKLMPLLSD